MKTKRFLGIFLALMQILLLASVPLCVAAEESTTGTIENRRNGSLNIYQLDDGVTIAIDGQASASELWDLIPWTTSAFQLVEKTGADDTHMLQADYSAKMKLMWQKKDGKAFLYALVEVDDKTLNGLDNNWTSDGFTIMIDEKADGSKELNTAALYVPERTDGVSYTGKDQLEYKVNDRRAEQGGYTLEFRYTFTDAANCADTLKFDIVLVDNLAKSSSDGDRYAKYSWGGAANCQGSAKAIGVICPEFVSTQPWATVPTTGVENADGSLNIYQLYDGVTVEIDGKASASELWDLIPWTTSAFKLVEKTGADDTHTLQEDYSAKMKLMWQKKDGKAFLYALVEVDDKTTNGVDNNWTSDGFTIMIDEKADSSKELDTAAIYVPERTDGVSYTGKDQLEYKVNDRRAEQGGYTLEFRYTFTDAANCADTLKFDIVLVDNLAKSSSDGDRYAKYSWGGAPNNQVLPKAVGVISDILVFDIHTVAGASVRVDTSEPNKSGIRFKTVVDTKAIAALETQGATVTTGTLLLPTQTLMANGITQLTKTALDEKGLTVDRDYYDIVNLGNTWLDGESGAFYGTLFNIKNFSRQFSAIGYVRVEFADGRVYMLYGGYDAANARSVAEVAKMAMENETLGDEGLYNTAQEAILQNFIEGGTRS